MLFTTCEPCEGRGWFGSGHPVDMCDACDGRGVVRVDLAAVRTVIALKLFEQDERDYGNGNRWCFDPERWGREADEIIAAIGGAARQGGG